MSAYKLLFITVIVSTSIAKAQDNCGTPAAVGYSFIKAVSTNDTTLFYQCVDATAFMNNANKNWGLAKKIGEDELHIMPFFLYGPWVILPEGLARLRNNFDSNCYFTMKYREVKDDVKEVYAEWNDTRKVYLQLSYVDKKWKVIDMHNQ